jgi:hypothetical protein
VSLHFLIIYYSGLIAQSSRLKARLRKWGWGKWERGG